MKPNTKIPCVIMRGGTSRALFFHDEDLPKDEAQRDRIILSAFGSPDLRQIDGLGGATTSTSKVAVIKKSERDDADVDYFFGQVSVDHPIVGKTMNCGNISSAVGPFAIDEGLVKAVEPVTRVRIYNVNTKKIINARVPVKNGKAVTEGDFSIDGVPGTGAKILLEFNRPQGAVSGKTLPSGSPVNTIEIEGKIYEYSFVDAANPVVFVHASQFGLKGTESPYEFEARSDYKEITRLLEVIRVTAAITIGLAKDLEDAAKNSQTLPKIGIYTEPVSYVTPDGKVIRKEDIDIVGRLFSMGRMIQAYMGTGAVCTIVAANTKGTLVNKIVTGGNDVCKKLKIGHPFGIMEVEAEVDSTPDGVDVSCAMIGRTARRLMDGFVYVRE
ncbi:MAG: PrpF domain-containing protein [Synergistaceae bacterium]|nr:PrpF domain-containing protein [Synergistaceae bacterium]